MEEMMKRLVMFCVLLLGAALPLSAQDNAADGACSPESVTAQVSRAYETYTGGESTIMEYIYDDLDTLANTIRAIELSCEESRYQAYAEEGSALLDALRQGGYVLYVRHTRTDRSQEDTDTASCETQRNLTEQGRVDATSIGTAWSALGVPVERIISTEYCRTRETAQLAFGEPTVIPRAELETSLDELLAEMPSAGMNTVIVGHSDSRRSSFERR
jgi:hypothetical protein